MVMSSIKLKIRDAFIPNGAPHEPDGVVTYFYLLHGAESFLRS